MNVYRYVTFNNIYYQQFFNLVALFSVFNGEVHLQILDPLSFFFS